MKGKALALSTFVVLCVAMTATPVAADDMADNCEEARVLSDGTYSDRITPNDKDVFILELDEGDYITANLSWDHNITSAVFFTDELTHTEVYTSVDLTETGKNARGEGISYSSIFSNNDKQRYPRADGSVQFEATAQGDAGKVCISIGTRSNERSHDWTLSFSTNQPAVEYGPGGSGDSGTVERLEQQLERKNETIQQLEERVDELESQLNATNNGQSITVQVTVNPSGNQQGFVQGGTAIVIAESAQAELSKLQIDYRGNTYSLDASGQAAIPLTGTGEQEVTFRYAGVSESVILDVQSQEQQRSTVTDTPSTDGGGEIIPVGSPGFGPIPALVALLAVAFLALRRSGGWFG